jgi:hypothetical protein
MLSPEECLRRAKECLQLSNAPGCSLRRSTALMALARSWDAVANDLIRLQEIESQEPRSGV